MIRILTALAMLASAAALPAIADVDEDEIVRLPRQGEVRNSEIRDQVKADRLKPAGGLFVSFDADTNGSITPSEIKAGIPIAFASADANSDGTLTALEQQAWAASLPTLDDTLANPVRFDPNLDRRVNLSEFSAVIQNLGIAYADEVSGEIIVASLIATDPDAPKHRPDKDNSFIQPRSGGHAKH